MIGDDAFYYLHQDERLQGFLTPLDAFTVVTIKKLVAKILFGVTVSKVERDKFRYTGLGTV